MADLSETEQTEAEPIDDIRSALNAAMESQEAPAAPAPAADKPAPAEAAEKPAERVRTPDGKFARADDEAAPEASTQAPATADKAAPAEAKAEPAAATKEAPANWAEADKAAFRGLPADAQTFLLRRHSEMEADYTRKTQRIAQFQREFEPVQQLFAPYANEMQAKGFTPASLIQSWYNAEKALMNPQSAPQAVAQIMQAYKVSPDQLAGVLGIRPQQPAANGEPPAPQPPANAPQLPPEIVDRLTAHEQWIAQQEARQQQMAAQQQQQHAQRVVTEIEQFAAAADSAGAPLHPYFKDVEDDMARHVIAARARGENVPPLSEIYDQAVWANPSTRTRLLDAQRAAEQAQRVAAEDKRKAEVRAKAEQSRRAGSSISGAPGGGPQAQGRRGSAGSVRDDIAAAFETLDA